MLSSALIGCAQGAPPPAAGGPLPFTVVPVARFSTPWALAFVPAADGQPGPIALVTESDGRLWLVDIRSGAKTAVAGAPQVKVDGQGGLGDVAFHPDYHHNHRVYLSFVEAGPDGTSGAALEYATLDLADPAHPLLRNAMIIWRQSPKVDGSGHFSHRIAFGPDRLLYLTSGERQKFQPAQDITGNLGKVLRLTDDGAAAPGNPWAASGGIAATFWSIGHRNLLGLAFAPDGRLWESEMGPMGGDEVNLIVPGRNYGWPRASNGSNYDGSDIPDHHPGDGFEPPRLFWNPSISPSSLLIYSGNRWPQWRGDALIGALSGEALIHVRLRGDGAQKADQWPLGARIRAVDQGPGGEVYLLEDKGRLVRLDPAKR